MLVPMPGRRATSLLLAIALAAALPGPAAAETAQPLERELDAAFAAFPAMAAVVVADPASGFRYARNADMQFYSASLYKLGLMVEAYRQAAAGALSLDDTVIGVTEIDLSAEDGWFVDAGTELSIREALEWTIAWSDNSTALALLRTLDVENVNATLAALGLTRTWVDRENGNLTTAADLERLFGLLLRGKIVSPTASAEMLQLLTRQRVSDRLSTGLPEGTVMAHKTGNLAHEAHDAGVAAAADDAGHAEVKPLAIKDGRQFREAVKERRNRRFEARARIDALAACSKPCVATMKSTLRTLQPKKDEDWEYFGTLITTCEDACKKP